MKKNKYEKMEELLQELMSDSNLDEKIDEMINSLEAEKDLMANIEMPQINVTGKTREEYEENFHRALEEAESGKKLKEKEIAERIQTIEEKLSMLQIFKNNKKQIINIRQFQLLNQEKLQELESKREEVSSTLDELLSKREELKKDGKRINDNKRNNIKRQAELEKMMARKDLSIEDKERLREELNNLSDDMNQNYEDSNAYTERKALIDKEIKQARANLQKLNKQVSTLHITISKCNVIWSSLLKGKNWDEIEQIIEDKQFTAEKGTLHKIRELNKRETAIDVKMEEQPVIEDKASSIETEGINKQVENQKPESEEIEPKQEEEESEVNQEPSFIDKNELLSIFSNRSIEKDEPTAPHAEEHLEQNNLPILSFEEQVNVFEDAIKDAEDKLGLIRADVLFFLQAKAPYRPEQSRALGYLDRKYHLTQIFRTVKNTENLCKVLEKKGELEKIENSKVHRLLSRIPILNRISRNKINILESEINEIYYEEEKQIVAENVQRIMNESGDTEHGEEKPELENVVEPDADAISQYFNAEEPKALEKAEKENIEATKLDVGLLDEINLKKKRSIKKYCRTWS